MDKLAPKYRLYRTSNSTSPDWPHFVLGARDPAAYAAMQAYIVRGKQLGYTQEYLDTVDAIAEHMEAHFREHGPSDVGSPKEPTLMDLAALCAEAEAQLGWCTGSDDFGPGGKAELGWKRGPAVVLEKLAAVRQRFFPSLRVPIKPEP